MNEKIIKSPEQTNREHQAGRKVAMTFAGVVYVGVVIAATTLFLSFIMTAFPNTAYASKAIMAVGGILVGGSALAFPIALHNWAVTGLHRNVTIALYYGEIAIMAINTIVSFATLLFTYAGAEIPAWIAWYEPLSIVSIVYVLGSWGTIFLLDPQIRLKAQTQASINKFDKKVADMVDQYLDSIEGEDAIKNVADQLIDQHFKAQLAHKAHWGSGNNNHKEPVKLLNSETQDFTPPRRDS